MLPEGREKLQGRGGKFIAMVVDPAMGIDGIGRTTSEFILDLKHLIMIELYVRR